jgi:hypothetical protein
MFEFEEIKDLKGSDLKNCLNLKIFNFEKCLDLTSV